jgi:hypothetical protein
MLSRLVTISKMCWNSMTSVGALLMVCLLQFSCSVPTPSPNRAPHPGPGADVAARDVHSGGATTTAQRTGKVPGPNSKPALFPDRDTLRAFRGDFCGVPLAVPYGPQLIYTPMYPAFDGAKRAEIRATYKGRGYTHFPINIDGGYVNRGREVYPRFHYSDQPTEYRRFLEELWQDGLIPVVFLMDDKGPHTAAYLSSFLTINRDLIKVASIGWELDDWMDSTEAATAARDLRRMLGPDVLLYAHMSPGRTAMCNSESCEAPWWASMRGVLDGILFQVQPTASTASLQSSLSDWVIRFRDGFKGWPTGFDVVAFEYACKREFDGMASEQYGIDRGNAAMQVEGVIGFGDGGPTR